MFTACRRAVLPTALAFAMLFGVIGPVIAQDATPEPGELYRWTTVRTQDTE